MRPNVRTFWIMVAVCAGAIGFAASARSAQRGAPAGGPPQAGQAGPAGRGAARGQGAPRGQGGAPGAPGARGPAGAAPGAQRGGGLPGTESGWSSFQTRCARCHLDPAADLAPSGVAIRQMTPEHIYEALTTGSMVEQSQGIADGQKRRIAEFMAGRPMGSSAAGSAKNMPNQCRTNPPMTDPSATAGWSGWGNGNANTRFQPAAAAGLNASNVPLLKVKWAFGFPTGETSSSQPTIAAGRVFVASDNGFLYSLDAATGCVYWSFEGGSIVRGSVVVGPVKGQGNTRYAAFFGDGHANIFGVDAQDGHMLWKTKVDQHVVARITAGTRYYDGKLIVPVSSSEEFSSGTPDYPCCSSRGSVVAMDASTGKIIWKTFAVPGEMKAYKIQSNGVVLYAPGGGGIWNSPTIDPARNAIYISTGDATTFPSPKTTDGVMALDINTGKLLWAYQADENDVFMGGCNGQAKSEACPNPMGPDLDIGNSPILQSLPGGKRVLMVGTKRGHVIGLDPDREGAVVYRVLASTGQAAPTGTGPRGGGGGNIVWGGAADASNVYYGAGGAGLTALRLGTGEKAWSFTAPNGGGQLGAAPTVIPGVVFEGSSSGRLYAVSSTDGKQLWEFNTAQEFETVNKVPAHGGAISMSGAVAANGMLFVTSGYAISSSASGGNVLLAFSVQ
ncbi:MAG TPA: PQQ-binding-like beta-propeller repeat protein [Terriglobia bacterium]|nr:PQQ-binding-like beta-propeller repeat protein [Terriglobia bacterium]